MHNNPILITGSHRSGTTWVGRMVASSPSVAYVHEPFNLLCRPGICDFQFKHWFAYAPDTDQEALHEAFLDTLRFRYHLVNELRICQNYRDWLRTVRDCTLTTAHRYRGARPLVKDPIALFSAPWLFDQFNMNIVVLIRHPAAFVSSLKLKRWFFPFDHLLQQNALMETYLSSFREDIQAQIDNEHDIIDQGILLWRIFHSVILSYKTTYPSWLFVRHEDLSRHPKAQFQQIFQHLMLPFLPAVAQKIDDSTSQANQIETTQNIHFVKRNSELNIWNWQQRLSPDEIQRIRLGTSDIADAFYTNDDWALTTKTLTP